MNNSEFRSTMNNNEAATMASAAWRGRRTALIATLFPFLILNFGCLQYFDKSTSVYTTQRKIRVLDTGLSSIMFVASH